VVRSALIGLAILVEHGEDDVAEERVGDVGGEIVGEFFDDLAVERREIEELFLIVFGIWIKDTGHQSVDLAVIGDCKSNLSSE